MSIDIRKLSVIDLSFPGIEIGCEQTAIDIFVENMHEYVSYASDQYSIRATRIIKKEKYDMGEEFQRIDMIEELASKDLPQFYYRNACVMLWAHFEWSLKRLIIYSRLKDSKLPPLGSKKHNLFADSFCKKIKKYFKKEFNYPEILDQRTWEELEALNTIRSNISHSNGMLAGIDEDKKEKLIKAVSSINSAYIKRDILVLSDGAVFNWHKLVKTAIARFIKLYARKYPGAEAFGDYET